MSRRRVWPRAAAAGRHAGRVVLAAAVAGMVATMARGAAEAQARKEDAGRARAARKALVERAQKWGRENPAFVDARSLAPRLVTIACDEDRCDASAELGFTMLKAGACDGFDLCRGRLKAGAHWSTLDLRLSPDGTSIDRLRTTATRRERD